MALTTDLKNDIYQKLIDAFSEQPEQLVRVLWYLDQEEPLYQGRPELPPVWRTLHNIRHNPVAFKAYAERMAEDTKRTERDAKFKSAICLVYDEMMCPEDAELEEDGHQPDGFEIVRGNAEANVCAVSRFLNFTRAWMLIPAASQQEIVKMLPKMICNVFPSAEKLMSMATKKTAVVMVALAGVYLSYKAIRNIRRWWRGEISGRRCAKNIIDCTFTIGAGITGGVAGAAVGTAAFGPVGTIIGGITGGILSSQAAKLLIDRLTQTLFGIPQEEALENAYNFLGVKMTASNAQVNTAFRKLCLKHHPDKGGKSEDFHFVQLNMAVIKMARRDL